MRGEIIGARLDKDARVIPLIPLIREVLKIMDTILGIPSNVVGNIIAAAGALAAAVISVLLKKWMEDRRTFQAISKDRRKVLLGDWSGTLANTYVEHGPDIPPYNLHVHVHTVGRRVNGVGTYSDDFGTENLKPDGGFYNSDYLQFSYESVSRARIQLGVVVLRLDASGLKLSGHFAGFSASREGFVVGDLALAKPGAIY